MDNNNISDYLSLDSDSNKIKKENNNSKTGMLIGIIILIILLLGLFTTLYLTFIKTSFFQKASGGSTSQVSLDNSYLFASPLQAATGGSEKIRITVFLLDGQGKGVMGKTVVLQADENLDVESVGSTTNDLGEAIFDISSNEKAAFIIQAKADQQTLPQKVSVIFN
jgi:hypothetical protein